jgi:hypothetical protein
MEGTTHQLGRGNAMTSPTNEESYASFSKIFEESRNVETLIANYERMATWKESRDAPLYEEFRPFGHAILEWVAPKLFRNPKVMVMITPASMLPVGKGYPIVAKSRLLQDFVTREELDNPTPENIAKVAERMGKVIGHFYWMENADRTWAQKGDLYIALYLPIVPLPRVADPSNGQERVGFQTRYALTMDSRE